MRVRIVRKKSFLIILLCLLCVLVVCRLLFPRPLTSYFAHSAPPDVGSVVLLYPSEEGNQVNLKGEGELAQIWEAIQKVKIHYAGSSAFVPSERHYVVQVQSREGAGAIAFDYLAPGLLLLGERSYQITSGEDGLRQALEAALKTEG